MYYCSHDLVFFIWSPSCYAVLGVLSRFASRRERESWLLNFSSRYHVAIRALCLFLVGPWVGLQCVIVALPGFTHFYSSPKCVHTQNCIS